MKNTPAFIYVALCVYFKFLDEGKIPYGTERELPTAVINAWQPFLNENKGKTYLRHLQVDDYYDPQIGSTVVVEEDYKAVQFFVANNMDNETESSYIVILRRTKEKTWKFNSLVWTKDNILHVCL